MYVHQLLYFSSVHGHLGCFHVLAAVSSVAVNTGYNVSLWIMFFYAYMPRSGLQGHMVAPFLVFYFSSQWMYKFTFPQRCRRVHFSLLTSILLREASLELPPILATQSTPSEAAKHMCLLQNYKETINFCFFKKISGGEGVLLLKGQKLAAGHKMTAEQKYRLCVWCQLEVQRARRKLKRQ